MWTSTRRSPTWDAAIAQGVDVIVTYPDFGDAMIPAMKKATDAGIPVATYAWGYVSGPGKNYMTVVGEDTCVTRQVVRVRHEQPGQVRRHRIPRRLPGEPAVRGLAEVRGACAQIRASTSSRRSRRTGIRPRCSRSWPESWRRIPTSRAGATSTGSAWPRAAYAAYKAAGIPFNTVLTLRTDDVGMGCLFNQLKNPKLEMYYYQLRQLAYPGRLSRPG